METLALALFVMELVICVVLNKPIIIAMLLGYAIFFTYSICRGFSLKETLIMSWEGALTFKNVIILFMFIGSMTAMWRMCGTIPSIVYYSASVIKPELMLFMCFALNAMLSTLTGSSFGTSATMGVICASIGRSMGLDIGLMGGAILSGVYVGDRCSLVSSTALLISDLTHTNLYTNFKLMLKTSFVPLCLASLIYLGLGFGYSGAGEIDDSAFKLFAANFKLGFVPVIPAIIVLSLSLMQVPAKTTMTCSIIVAIFISIFMQDYELPEILHAIVYGFEAKDPQLGKMINGGGIISMYSVIYVVVTSAAFAGIFKGTGLLLKLKDRLNALAKIISPFGVFIVSAGVSAMISGSQMVSSVITQQLCNQLETDDQRMAINLENTAVILPALVPWGVAAIVPCTMIDVIPMQVVAYAFYLYLLPLWRFWVQSIRHSY